MSVASQSPFAHSSMHLARSTLHCLCILKTWAGWKCSKRPPLAREGTTYNLCIHTYVRMYIHTYYLYVYVYVYMYICIWLTTEAHLFFARCRRICMLICTYQSAQLRKGASHLPEICITRVAGVYVQWHINCTPRRQGGGGGWRRPTEKMSWHKTA